MSDAKHLGRKVEVWWDSDEAWYRGRIDNYHPTQGWHVQYDDGEREWIAETQLGDLVRFVDDHDNDAYPDDEYEGDGHRDRDRYDPDDDGDDYGRTHDSSELNVVSGTQVYRNVVGSPSATQQPPSYDAQVRRTSRCGPRGAFPLRFWPRRSRPLPHALLLLSAVLPPQDRDLRASGPRSIAFREDDKAFDERLGLGQVCRHIAPRPPRPQPAACSLPPAASRASSHRPRDAQSPSAPPLAVPAHHPGRRETQ